MIVEAQIVRDIQAGGSLREKAIQELLKHAWSGQSKHYIMRKMSSKEDAEELFQDTITDCVMNIVRDKFRGDASIKTYLYNIARNKVAKYYERRKKADMTDIEDYQHIIPDTESDGVEDRDLQHTVGKLLSLLPDICRQVLMMPYLGYKNEDIAKKFNIKNAQLVRNKRVFCKRKLMDILRGKPELRTVLQELL